MGLRLFLAIDLPDSIKQILIDSQKDLPGRLNKNFHITLKFIGDVNNEELPGLIKKLSTITFRPFTLRLNNLGAFPDLGHPRVIWVGLDPEIPLIDLHNQIAKALDFQPDLKPHITLSRIGFGKKPGFLQKMSVTSEPFEVKEFHLYSSELTPQGAVHNIIHTFRLSQPL